MALHNSKSDLLLILRYFSFYRCAKKHPYHTLPIILALANSEADERVIQEQTNKRRLSVAEEENDRTKAAKEIIQRLKNGSLSDITVKTEQMSLALIQLAYTPAREKVAKQSIPSGQPILKLKNMDRVLLPTHTLKIVKSGDYLDSDFCGVSKFEVSSKIDHDSSVPRCKIGICKIFFFF